MITLDATMVPPFMTTSAPDAPAAAALDCSDRTAVHRLYQRLGRAVVHRVRRVVRRDDVAQEILQETFVRLWTAGPLFTSESSAFTWVYKTSHRLALDHLRSRFSNSAFVDNETLATLAGVPGTQEDEAVQQQLLHRVIGRLGDDEASFFVLKVVDQMTLEEIGTFAGVSSKTVSRVLARVDRKIAQFRGAQQHEF